MPDFLHDPELDRLVKDLNRTGEGEEAAPERPSPAAVDEDREGRPGRPGGTGSPGLTPARRLRVAADEPLERLLAEMVRREASDLHLLAGSVPVLRIHGELVRLEGTEAGGGEMGELGDDQLRMLFAPHLSGLARRRLDEEGATDFSLRLQHPRLGDWRFRVNLHRQRGRLAAAVRALPRKVPTVAELNLPPELTDLVTTPRGLVLVTGPAGSGKSSTLAALVDHLNRERSLHVLTIEDPVEYEHRSRRCLVEQVEIGVDSPSYAAALKASLRQDPDVILVGEMREVETMATALTAAETGHLVLTTLHTRNVGQTVHRIVDVFGDERQAQVRQQLAMALHAVVSQQLLPRADGSGRVPAVEVMRTTYAVRRHIRSNQLQKLDDEITRGRGEGMRSMEESLAAWVRREAVTPDEARERAFRPDELRSLMMG